MAKVYVIFVEGDTDELFFKAIINQYRCKYPQETEKIKISIINLRGIGNYSTKALALLKNKILKEVKAKKDTLNGVFCTHDTDVFEFSSYPPIEWPHLLNDFKKLAPKAEIMKIDIRYSIEDWLLSDMEGICKYLKIKNPPRNIKGTNGYAKMKSLFKMRDKIYTKGYDCENFMEYINFEKIISIHKEALLPIERIFTNKC